MGSTLREALESAVSAQEAKESQLAEAPAQPVEQAAPIEGVQPAAGEAPVGESAEARAERLRDEKGRFVEGKAEVKAKEAPAAPVAAVAPVIPKIPKPDSWKKEFTEHWDKLDPAVAKYVKEREDQYFKGVSTYKQEWESAKPLLDAVAPFLPTLQQHNIKPDQWITNLGRAHHTLATGDGQSKLQMFAKLAQDYGVPLQALYDQQAAQQFVQQQIQRPQQPQQQQDVGSTVREILAQERAKASLAEFERDAPTKYQHYEVVKPDMALLLEAGKANDFPSAYEMALRLHDDLFAAQQAERQKADEASRLEAQRKVVAAAKGSAVSVKSATPASAGSAPQKGIRASLEAAYDQHANGRV